MVIERTANEFVIRFPITSDIEQIQDVIDYLRYKELTGSYSVPQSEVDQLAREINTNWWENNKAKFQK
ncbi:MAG: hypothetical protein LBQ39_03220 [Tannerellaceae bacterium]|jgi:hypothetical protein|nr:hypothetical protein [Tannerellaceae bacterium]